ncbi:MAG: PIN domain-containing protein [Planctomycetota bacterium]|nr:PIN domain-containing protein [Planctomycetota bacterium]
MIFVDTGFLLALAQPTDALHNRAKAWSAAINEPLLVTEYVVWETVNGLSRPVDRPKAQLTVAHIQSSPQWELLPASSVLFQAGWQLHRERDDKAWSLTDCISFGVMQQRGLRQALTADKHFEQAGFEAYLHRDPL